MWDWGRLKTLLDIAGNFYISTLKQTQDSKICLPVSAARRFPGPRGHMNAEAMFAPSPPEYHDAKMPGVE